jgi:hypothetical protein
MRRRADGAQLPGKIDIFFSGMDSGQKQFAGKTLINKNNLAARGFATFRPAPARRTESGYRAAIDIKIADAKFNFRKKLKHIILRSCLIRISDQIRVLRF